MASGKRASMREGPLAALFRRTDEEADQAPETPAPAPEARAPQAPAPTPAAAPPEIPPLAALT